MRERKEGGGGIWTRRSKAAWRLAGPIASPEPPVDARGSLREGEWLGEGELQAKVKEEGGVPKK